MSWCDCWRPSGVTLRKINGIAGYFSRCCPTLLLKSFRCTRVRALFTLLIISRLVTAEKTMRPHDASWVKTGP